MYHLNHFLKKISLSVLMWSKALWSLVQAPSIASNWSPSLLSRCTIICSSPSSQSDCFQKQLNQIMSHTYTPSSPQPPPTHQFKPLIASHWTQYKPSFLSWSREPWGEIWSHLSPPASARASPPPASRLSRLQIHQLAPNLAPLHWLFLCLKCSSPELQ